MFVELFHVPDMDLGPVDAGISCMWSLQLADWEAWASHTKEADLYYEGTRELLNSFKYGSDVIQFGF